MKRFIALSVILTSLLTFIYFSPSASASNISSDWLSTTNLPTQLASETAYSFNNTVSVIGGATLQAIPTNISALQNSNGTLQTWVSSISSPALYWSASAQVNNHFYILGGATYPPQTSSNNVFLGTIDSNGKINAWVAQNGLPKALSRGAAAIVNNRLYFAGGFTTQNGSISVNDVVYSAPIGSDGILGSWTQAGKLPSTLDSFGMINNNNHLIIIGGAGPNGIVNSVYTTSIAADGSIIGWQSTTSLPVPNFRFGITSTADTVFVIGGKKSENASDYLDTVYSAPLHPDGTVGSWALSSHHLPQPLCCGAATNASNYLYMIGGFNANSNSYLDSVYYAKISDTTTGDISLSVPLVKQTVSPWGPKMYDSAPQWTTSPTTIAWWGCAMTDADMILRYYGITKLPDGTDLNPGTLNTWLLHFPGGYINGKHVSGGFVNGGEVNWEAIAALSSLAKKSGHNPNFPYDALEFRGHVPFSIDRITNDLANGQPDIIFEKNPGHWITSTGIQGGTITINDPGYNKTTLAQYGNSGDDMVIFTPSHTDLSFIEASTVDNLQFTTTDENNNTVGDQVAEDPISAPEDNSKTNGVPLTLFELAQPSAGTYHVTISGDANTAYTFDLYVYDSAGNTKITPVTGMLDDQGTDTITIAFDPAHISTVTIDRNVTFATLIQDIKSFQSSGDIHPKGIAESLIVGARAMQVEVNKWKKENLDHQLALYQKLLNLDHRKFVDDTAYAVLTSDVTQLQKTY